MFPSCRPTKSYYIIRRADVLLRFLSHYSTARGGKCHAVYIYIILIYKREESQKDT